MNQHYLYLMDQAKITLSAEELALALNAGWLLTKNGIIEKAYALFGRMSEVIRNLGEENRHYFPAELLSIPPKISKGENYKGLPYVILDYPRSFSRDNVFAFRTMFWWGNFISVTLHLKGEHRSIFSPAIKKNIQLLADKNFFAGMDEDEWRHDFGADHYRLLSAMSAADRALTLDTGKHSKLAVKIPLEKWNNLEELLPPLYRALYNVLDDQFPNR